jgi:hypothetical protein
VADRALIFGEDPGKVYCHKSAYIEHCITSDLWSIHRELSR